MYGGRQRNARAGHLGDARAPGTTGDDDVLGLDVALVGADARDDAVLDVDAEHLGVGRDGEGAELGRALTHDRAGAKRVDDADRGRVEPAEDDLLVDVGDELLDLGRGHEAAAVDSPRLARGDAAGELLHALGGASDLDAAALGEDVHLLVLSHGLSGQVRHLLGVVHREDEVRGVTSRAAGVGQRALVDLHDVAPPETGQVVHEAVADDAGADDDALGLGRKAHRTSFRIVPAAPERQR